MSQAKKGDKVKVHYTGKLKNGDVFDSSKDKTPIEFTLGNGDLIAGFESAVLGMNIGDSKTVVIVADEAYGSYNDEMAIEVERSQFPKKIEPKVGEQLELDREGGCGGGDCGSHDCNKLVVTITEVTDAVVKLDANHPLAGHDLTFEIELVEIA
ncbi:MAG: peptidylprolyl isomerase [Deltaproteobacteria bacterium]|jgi:peptidylprolyl isomerase|nr:peptidylprolyl isomerase [Deltaproteobacteria bacterium]